MPANSKSVTLCQWCDKVAHRGAPAPDDLWVTRQEWEARHGRLAGTLSHGICPGCLAAMLRHGRTPRTRPDADGVQNSRETLLNRLIQHRMMSPWAAAGHGDPLVCLPPPEVCHHHDKDADCTRMRATLGLPPMVLADG